MLEVYHEEVLTSLGLVKPIVKVMSKTLPNESGSRNDIYSSGSKKQ